MIVGALYRILLTDFVSEQKNILCLLRLREISKILQVYEFNHFYLQYLHVRDMDMSIINIFKPF
jgi:hypothetical protein